MAKNINEKTFDEATKLKLNIFGECFKEWLPVFNYNQYIEKIYIFDFFAGSGTDIENHSGSPLVLINAAKGKERQYCAKSEKDTIFIFNEGLKAKRDDLQLNVENYVKACTLENNCAKCTYKFAFLNYQFKDIIDNEKIKSILENPRYGKFVLLDQYGFSEIDENIFRNLISYPKTDFIFFISSSLINRFSNHPNVTKYFDTSKINFEDSNPNEIHRLIANYFKGLIPKGQEYYLHHFSIQKDPKKGNYYGLIFGSAHTLGMEKFLKVCWLHDENAGEANFNIDNNYEKNTLFHDAQNPFKKVEVKKDIKNQILSGSISDNIAGFKYVMSQGCEPKLFTEVVKELEKQKVIFREGDLNYSSTNIHVAKKYFIKLLKNVK